MCRMQNQAAALSGVSSKANQIICGIFPVMKFDTGQNFAAG